MPKSDILEQIYRLIDELGDQVYSPKHRKEQSDKLKRLIRELVKTTNAD